MYMSKKQRWKWSDMDTKEPIERSPIKANPKNDNTYNTNEDNKKNEKNEEPNASSIEYLDSFFDDKHMRESTYERMSKREPMMQTGTNPYLQNSYLDGIVIRDKYLMPYHESKPRTRKNELET